MTPEQQRIYREFRVVGIYVFFIVLSLQFIFISSTKLFVFLSSVLLAITLFLLRIRFRFVYGSGEIVFALFILWDADGKGHGSFNKDFSPDLETFQVSVILIQTFAAIYVLVRGLDNLIQGLPEARRKSFEKRVKEWVPWKPFVGLYERNGEGGG